MRALHTLTGMVTFSFMSGALLKISMPLTLSTDPVDVALIPSADVQIAKRLQESHRLQRRLKFELQNVAQQVKALELLMNTPKRKFEYPNNFENSVRLNSRNNQSHALVTSRVLPESYATPAPKDSLETNALLNLDSVSSKTSLAAGKYRGQRRSVWGTLPCSCTVSLEDSNTQECHPENAAAVHDVSLLPPQILTKPSIERLSECFNCNPAKSTPPITLIATWTPDGGPRPSHLTPVVPGRDTEEASSGGKRIVFSNKLFKRKGHVDWNRFNRADTTCDSSAMAFLFESPPAYSERSFPTSRISPSSTCRRIIHISD